jgi:hypothetical protein
MAETVQRTIRRPFFSYNAPLLDPTGEPILDLAGKPAYYQKLGYKGETVDLYPADAARGDEHGVFLADGESLEAPSTESLRLNDIGLLSDEQLALMWEDKAPKVADLLQAVGENPELAQRVLDAETKATAGDPRATLKSGLDKVIHGGEPQ